MRWVLVFRRRRSEMTTRPLKPNGGSAASARDATAHSAADMSMAGLSCSNHVLVRARFIGCSRRNPAGLRKQSGLDRHSAVDPTQLKGELRGQSVKRENIALLARARHDPEARRELGRLYLSGEEGFARHEQLALEYLSHPSIRDTNAVARVICEHLPLERMIELDFGAHLQRAADDDCAEAQFKLGIWLTLRGAVAEPAMRWFACAARSGHKAAARVHHELEEAKPSGHESLLVAALQRSPAVRLEAVALAAAAWATHRQDLSMLARCVRIVLAIQPGSILPVAHHVKTAVVLAVESRTPLPPLRAADVELCLDALATDGDMEAADMLGRAYCGSASPPIRFDQLVETTNLRKGAALLLRAADAGRTEAWMQLFRVHADHRCSVANPQLARFFLEKAALLGDAEAQRRLGTMVLRSASTLKESESAIHWLHTAAAQGDSLAADLLRTLVLAPQGDSQDAERAIEAVRRADPWLAARLRLSRDFGLTKLEALCVDPIAGSRRWGLVVGRNPFIELPKLSAPRAIPALSAEALANLGRTSLMFEAAHRDGNMLEGDYRRRSARQRTVFGRLHIDEALFFVKASTTTLESLRKGPKWALRAKPVLIRALADASFAATRARGHSAGAA